jgi:hypothetical protein
VANYFFDVIISVVIIRLDRTIQYAAADVFNLRRLRLLDTRFRGYDGVVAEAPPHLTRSIAAPAAGHC